MVAVIHASRSLRSCLRYNEEKIKIGQARLLEAGYYPMDAKDMTFNQKLVRLQKLTELNQWTKFNSVHISLNFDPSERLSEQLLTEISALYLEKIGFGTQPYLLYEHFDAGHPHVHLVTTNIKPDGKRIPLHNLPKNQSEKARREIELLYGLVPAQDGARRKLLRPEAVNAERILYGRMETKKAIERVLAQVLKSYRFSSLAQLNAILALYNLNADTGSEHSRLRQYGGLVYRVLDRNGKKVGAPLKASDLAGKPTLKTIRGMFLENETAKAPHRGRLRNAIALALLREEISLSGLRKALQSEGIDLAVPLNKAAGSGEITYIDHVKKTVFTGSELGSPYTLAAILERCQKGLKVTGAGPQIPELTDSPLFNTAQAGTSERKNHIVSLLDVLLDPGSQPEIPDWQLRRRRKKRKKQQVEK